MTSVHKTALSLLISIILFGACLCFAIFGGFDFLEIHFYEPRVVETASQRLEEISFAYADYEDELKISLSEYAGESSVQTYIERQASSEESKKRAQLTGKLFDDLPGLEGIRIIESNGENIHFSSFEQDKKNETSDILAYKNYTELNELPSTMISVPDNGAFCKSTEEYKERCSVYYDSQKERIIYSLPYFDHYTAYRGTIVFYISADDMMRELIARNIVSLNTRCCLVAPMDKTANFQNEKNSGIVLNLPYSSRSQIKIDVAEKWEKGLFGVEQLLKSNVDDKILVLVSKAGQKSLSFGWILYEEDFTFSNAERFLILLCTYITIFLIVFLLFNIKHDDMVVIRGRVHKFHMALLSEYLERHDTADWATITKELNYRKVDANEEIKRSLGRKGKRYSKEIDELLDESWNDFFNAVGGINIVKKINVEEEVEKESAPVVSSETHKTEERTDFSEVEEVVEEVEECDPVEELEDVPEADVLEDVEECDPVEEPEDVPEAESVEEVEEYDPIEELESALGAESAEAVEECESTEEPEVVSEVDSADNSGAEEPGVTPKPSVTLEKEKSGFLAMAQSLKDEDAAIIAEVPGLGEKKDVKKDEAFAEGFEINNPDFSGLDESSPIEKN